MCLDGECVGDMSGCVCTPEFDDAAKLTFLSIGADTSDGEALDVDGDGQIDNSLGPLGAIANEPLAGAVEDGSIMLVLEFDTLTQGAFTLALTLALKGSPTSQALFTNWKPWVMS